MKTQLNLLRLPLEKYSPQKKISPEDQSIPGQCNKCHYKNIDTMLRVIVQEYFNQTGIREGFLEEARFQLSFKGKLKKTRKNGNGIPLKGSPFIKSQKCHT